jgi:predicted ATP-dependent endonuclease of OLD family
MFCPEERYPREIYWSGFGFQVWCQMLTFIVRAKKSSLLIIDEPDIYLHSDLQRQLVSLLKDIEPDVLIATHSTEIISEADPGDLLVVNKKRQSAKRIKNPSQIQDIFGALGSNLNLTLTQLAKSRRAVFVEGKDFQIFSAFSRMIGKQAVANRSDFAVISVEGFNPQKVNDFSKGMELTLGGKLLKAIIFDRDYRSQEEVETITKQLKKISDFARIHCRKEIENYLLSDSALQRAIEKQIKEYNKRTNSEITFNVDMTAILDEITEKLKNKVRGQFMSHGYKYLKSKNPAWDTATINQKLLEDFDTIWANPNGRLSIVPGKEVLSQINNYLQENYKVTLTPNMIISSMTISEIPEEIVSLIESLEDFSKLTA